MEHSNQKQINIGLGLAVLVFIITTVISYRSTAHLVETAETVAHTRQVLEEIEEVFSVVKDAETGQRGYIITGDEKFLEPYQAAISHLDPAIQSLRKLTADNPTQQLKVDTLEQLIERRFRSLKEGLDLRTDQGFAPAMRWVLKGGGKGEMDAIRRVIAEMRQEENRLLKDREERAQAQTQKTLRILLVAALLGLTIFVPVFYFLNREIEERRRAEEAARRSGLFLDSIIENIPNMLFVKEAKELRFVRFNKAGEALLGYAKEDLIGKNDYDFFPKEQADFFIAKDRQVLNEGKLIDISEEPIQTRHQGSRILHTKKIPFPGGGGPPLFARHLGRYYRTQTGGGQDPTGK
ncbi:MAG: CHASE3 domain-containing protein [Candidatus Manganitrophus sp.]|nr:MAG: CHASE3 domain-containing protein [Candidatus Manganitrophus sp.]